MEFSHPHFHYSLAVFLDHLTTEFPRVVGANVIVLLPVPIYFLRRNFGRLNTTEILMLAFAATCFLVPVIMLFSPEFTLRISITSMVFALVASASAIFELERRPIKILPEKILRGVSTGLIAVFLAYCATLIYMDVQFFKATCQTEEFLQTHKDIELIKLQPVPISHRFDRIHVTATGSRDITWRISAALIPTLRIAATSLPRSFTVLKLSSPSTIKNICQKPRSALKFKLSITP